MKNAVHFGYIFFLFISGSLYALLVDLQQNLTSFFTESICRTQIDCQHCSRQCLSVALSSTHQSY